MHSAVDNQEGDYSNDRDQHRWEDEDVPLLVIIGGGGNDHTQREGGDPRRDRVELGLNWVKAEVSEEGGCEERITGDDTEVHETTEDDLEDAENVLPLSVKPRVIDIHGEPGFDEGLLVTR